MTVNNRLNGVNWSLGCLKLPWLSHESNETVRWDIKGSGGAMLDSSTMRSMRSICRDFGPETTLSTCMQCLHANWNKATTMLYTPCWNIFVFSSTTKHWARGWPSRCKSDPLPHVSTILQENTTHRTPLGGKCVTAVVAISNLRVYTHPKARMYWGNGTK